MGLDMYLIRRKYVGANYKHRNVKGLIQITIGDKTLPIEFDRITYIDEEVGYWRKANAIHKWFVDNVQDGVDDCKTYYVNYSELKTLLELCKKVKEKAILKEGTIHNGYKFENGKAIPIEEKGKYIENDEEIEELLPTQEGFFFGSTAYDDYYMQDIEDTIKILEKLFEEEKELNELGFYSDFQYHSSW